MPDYKLNIIGTFNNKQLVKALKNAGVNVDKLKRKAKEAEKGMGGFRNATAGLRRTLGAVRNNLLLVSFAFGTLGVAIKKATDEFIKFEQVKIAFDALTEAAGLQGDVLLELQKATDGTVKSSELMTQANNAMLLGIVESTDQMANMFDVAQRLASAVGQDAAFGVQSLTTGMGRQSKLMLDNLGIIVDVNSAYEKHAKVLKKSANTLTDAERKTAFINATMESAAEKVEQLGEENLKQVDIMRQASVAWAEGSRSMGELLGPAVIFVSKQMKTFADRWKFAMDMMKDRTPIQEYVVALEGLEESEENVHFALDKFYQLTGEMPRRMTSSGVAIDSLDDQLRLLIQRMEEGSTTVKKGQWLTDEMLLNNLRLALEKLVIAQEKLNKFEEEGVNKKKGSGEVIDDFTRRYREYVTTQQIAMNQSKDEAQFIEMLTAQYEELATFLGLGYEGYAEKQLEVHDNYVKEQEMLAQFIEQYPEVAKAMNLVTDAKKKENEETKTQKQLEKEKARQIVTNLQKAAEQFPILEKAAKRAAQIQALVDSYASAQAAAKAVSGIPIVGPALAPIAYAAALAKGFATVQKIEAAETGMDKIVTQPTLIMAGEGGKAEHIGITPLEGPNLEGPQGGSNITLNISAPLVDESVVDHIIPAINEAVRRGETLATS